VRRAGKRKTLYVIKNKTERSSRAQQDACFQSCGSGNSDYVALEL
jgi:hypothetical protein